jgi:protein-S-isoprenylcysteine O-methyltransferase Ste14
MAQRVVTLAAGATVFLVVLPWLLVIVGGVLSRWIGLEWPRGLELVVGVPAAIVGLLVVGWTTATQWTLGKGTPAPVTPPRHLIVEGPYKLCRNPIQLGATLYFLGIGTLFESLTTGLLGLVLFSTLGSAYHKLIEEKELLVRFGDEYREYRDRTPFLIPRVRRRSRRAP